VAGDPLRREATADEGPPALVLGVVHRDHHREMLTVWPRRPEARECVRVLFDCEHVGMLEDAPHLTDRVEMHWRRSPENPFLIRNYPASQIVLLRHSCRWC